MKDSRCFLLNKKIVITGVAGFIGSHLAKELIEEGNFVIGVDDLSSGKIKNIMNLNKDKFLFLHLDVCSNKMLKLPQLKDIHEIYHLASPASPKFYQETPFATIDSNTIGMKNMLELAKINNAKIVYTSTSETYGDPEVHPQPETYRGNVNTWGPRACYDESKRLGEVLCYLYYTIHRVQVKVARLFNTYSAGLSNDDGRVVSNFVTQALKGEDITVYGDGSQTRSFCYVTDTIRGLKLLMEKDSATGQVINIGNPKEYTILEIANIIKSLTKSNSNITFHSLPQDDPLKRNPDIKKAKELLGWEPTVTLQDGLIYTISEYRKKLNLTS